MDDDTPPPPFTEREIDAGLLHADYLRQNGLAWFPAALLARDLADKLRAERLKPPAPG